MGILVSMSEVESPPVSRQRQVGAASRAETKRRLLEAAAVEFVEHGYAAATIARIAMRAGVTVQTLYLAWGSKRALLRAYLETALGDGAPYPESALERFVGKAPGEVVKEIAVLHGEIAARSATAWELYRDAAATDPDIAADWQQLHALRRGTFQRILGIIPDSALRSGLRRDIATDSVWVIASPESYDLLVRRAGYSPVEFREWIASTLATALLAP